jgi:ketosteroid isomerase-like protein
VGSRGSPPDYPGSIASGDDPTELVRAALEAWNAGDVESFIDALDPDFEIDASENVFNPRVFRGRDSVPQFLEMVRETWEDFRFELLDASVDGDSVTARVRTRGRAKLSGVEVESDVTQVWTVREGRLLRVKNYPQ